MLEMDRVVDALYGMRLLHQPSGPTTAIGHLDFDMDRTEVVRTLSMNQMNTISDLDRTELDDSDLDTVRVRGIQAPKRFKQLLVRSTLTFLIDILREVAANRLRLQVYSWRDILQVVELRMETMSGYQESDVHPSDFIRTRPVIPRQVLQRSLARLEALMKLEPTTP
jgi:hypothetical protein